MIGFRDQSVVRRPVYSDATGQKLAYIVSGPTGEWIVSLSGRRIGRVTKFKAAKLKQRNDIGTSLGGAVIEPADTWEM